MEPEPALELATEGGGDAALHLHQAPAPFADEVLVEARGAQVIDAGRMAEMRVAEDADLLQRRKRPVDRRGAHRGKLRADALGDLLRRRVSRRICDGLQRGLALRRPAQPMRSEQALDLVGGVVVIS